MGGNTENKPKQCCICRRWFLGYGNNPEPVRNDGRCCDNCNVSVVLPARYKMLMEKPAR